MFSLIPNYLPLPLRSPRVIVAIGVAAAASVGVASYALTRRRPSAEELERERRDLLARTGRITDGTIMDTMITETPPTEAHNPDFVTPAESSQPTEPPIPHIIVYNYRIAGVTYECAQDVTTLAEYVHGVRTDLPVQVRYEPHNPVNSIIVAETWSGLRLNTSTSQPCRNDSGSTT